MLLKIKIHVLCKRHGTELGEPMVFATHRQAFTSMEKQFNTAAREYDWYSRDDSYLSDYSAIVAASDDWEEWSINECEVEIGSLNDYSSVFESLLGKYNAGFSEFISKAPQAMTMAATLTETLRDLHALLSAALPERAGTGEEGSG